MLILSVALLVLRWPQIPPEVPLYFSRPWGESQLAPSESLILLPTLSVLIYLANFTLALLLARGDKLITEILIKGALFAAGILLYSMVRIILLIS